MYNIQSYTIDHVITFNHTVCLFQSRDASSPSATSDLPTLDSAPSTTVTSQRRRSSASSRHAGAGGDEQVRALLSAREKEVENWKEKCSHLTEQLNSVERCYEVEVSTKYLSTVTYCLVLDGYRISRPFSDSHLARALYIFG